MSHCRHFAGDAPADGRFQSCDRRHYQQRRADGCCCGQDRALVKTTWAPQDLWRTWLLALNQAGASTSRWRIPLEGILGRPGAKEVTPLFLLRIRALLALNKNDEAMQAAKSCYNDCEYSSTPQVVLLVAECSSAAPAVKTKKSEAHLNCRTGRRQPPARRRGTKFLQRHPSHSQVHHYRYHH